MINASGSTISITLVRNLIYETKGYGQLEIACHPEQLRLLEETGITVHQRITSFTTNSAYEYGEDGYQVRKSIMGMLVYTDPKLRRDEFYLRDSEKRIVAKIQHLYCKPEPEPKTVLIKYSHPDGTIHSVVGTSHPKSAYPGSMEKVAEQREKEKAKAFTEAVTKYQAVVNMRNETMMFTRDGLYRISDGSPKKISEKITQTAAAKPEKKELFKKPKRSICIE